ncbi:MAG: hypothetical protein WBF04_13995 [Candidatus Sulfotelmatobacter sp.]
MVGASFAQKAASAPDPVLNSGANVRPAIFQRSEPTIAASASVSSAQLSRASLRLASDSEVDGMEQVLGRYVAAFESLNLAALKQVWPNLDRQHATAFKDLFAGFKGVSANPRLALQCAVPRVSEDTANVDCRETITYQTGKGKGKTKELGPASVSIQMKGESSHWVVSDMTGSN